MELETRHYECGNLSKGCKIPEKVERTAKRTYKKALEQLAKEPPQGDIKFLAGRDGYRLRVGDYRVLFDIIDNEIAVHEIGSRGQIYRGRR